MKVKEMERELGFKLDVEKFMPEPMIELFGHVTLVEGYDVPGFDGCHALVKLRDERKTVAVLTDAIRLQSLLETALGTGNPIAFRGQRMLHPPTPLGGTWSVEVYDIHNVILYS